MDDYDDRLEHLRDAEGEDNTDPSAPDAPGCFPRIPTAEEFEAMEPSARHAFNKAYEAANAKPTTCPVERVIEAMESHSPLDAAIAGGMKGPIGPLYVVPEDERF